MSSVFLSLDPFLSDLFSRYHFPTVTQVRTDLLDLLGVVNTVAPQYLEES